MNGIAARRAIVVAVALRAAIAASAAGADTPAPAPPKPAACTAAAYRQFDFWIGEWDVADAAGKPQGRNRIVAVHDGCALQENWSGNGGFTGTSLNAYDAGRRAWHQTWIDNGGGVLKLDGGLVDGRMVLSGEVLEGGRRVLQRIAWEKLADGRVRQLWEASKDGGTTWTVAFDGYYRKR